MVSDVVLGTVEDSPTEAVAAATSPTRRVMNHLAGQLIAGGYARKPQDALAADLMALGANTETGNYLIQATCDLSLSRGQWDVTKPVGRAVDFLARYQAIAGVDAAQFDTMVRTAVTETPQEQGTGFFVRGSSGDTGSRLEGLLKRPNMNGTGFVP